MPPLSPGLSWLSGTATGAAWLRALPAVVERCAAEWTLTLGVPFPDAHVSLVLPGRRADGCPVALKVQFPHHESTGEGAAVRHWAGGGAVRLLAEDRRCHALLLERCRPGTPLAAAGPEQALDVMGQLLARLAVPAGAPFVSLAAEAARWADELPASWERAGRPFERALVEAAVGLLDALGPTQGAPVLVHQDLHGANVLAAEREPWLAIDPKPLVGERAFAVAPVVRSPELGHSAAQVYRRLDRLVDELGLDPERAAGWTVAQSLAWALDPAGAVTANVEVARWLLARRRASPRGGGRAATLRP